jgi:predicted dehydrogenase
VLARPDIDAVFITTPDHWHSIIAIEAARAGKDIYCEKPLALTISEARAVAQAVERYGRVFQTGSQQRSDRTFRFACELVRNGRIGRVHTVHVNVGGPPVDCDLPEEPAPPCLDWDRWLGPAPWRPYNAILAPPITDDGWALWRNYRDYAGGGMTDMGAHHFDIAQWGLGMDGAGPVQIIPPDGKGVNLLTYRYANGVLMTHTGALEKAGVEFIGDKGRVLVNRYDYLVTEPKELARQGFGPGDVRLCRSDDHHLNWAECIRTRGRPICDAEIGCRSVTVCHLGNIAYQLKRPLRWDPGKEIFVGDEEANRLLRRPMRAPWCI